MSSDPSGGLPIVQRTTAANVAAVLLAAITAAGAVAVRSQIGAGTSNVTLPGTGVAITLSGDAGTLDAAGAADGAVVSLVNGVPTYATVAASGPTVTTLRASDCTAEAGSESASISGTGAASTLTIGASSVQLFYNTSAATAARVVCPIPAGAWSVDVEFAVTAASNWPSSGFRYLGIALRNTANGGVPTALWGMSVNDTGASWVGNISANPNAASALSTTAGAGGPAADRWYRLALRPLESYIGALSGVGSAGARPARWSPMNAAALPVGPTAYVVDTNVASAVVVWVQSFGGGSSPTSITGSLTIRVISL